MIIKKEGKLYFSQAIVWLERGGDVEEDGDLIDGEAETSAADLSSLRIGFSNGDTLTFEAADGEDPRSIYNDLLREFPDLE